MEKLYNIELTKEEYQGMLYSYYFSTEAYVTREGAYARKIFKTNFGQSNCSKDEIEEIRENKFCKINTLFSFGKKFNNAFRPLSTYSYQGKFVGYRGRWFSYPDMQYEILDREDKIYYLKKIKEKLEQFHELGIVYGDIKDNNILLCYSLRDIILLDIDNMQVGSYSIDLLGKFAQNFISHYGNVDEKLDSYMMNLLTLEQLFESSGWYDEVLACLEVGFLPEEFREGHRLYKSKRLAREMSFVTSSYSGEYFIDQL